MSTPDTSAPVSQEALNFFTNQIRMDVIAMESAFDLQSTHAAFVAGISMAVETVRDLAESPEHWPPGVESVEHALVAYAAAAKTEIAKFVK